jgi:hypothetical protein
VSRSGRGVVALYHLETTKRGGGGERAAVVLDRDRRVLRRGFRIDRVRVQTAGPVLTASSESVTDCRTANLQRLTMGETFTIVGAILSGFAWRPKV